MTKTPMHSFQAATVAAREAGKPEETSAFPPIPFAVKDDELGFAEEFLASKPSDGTLMLFMASYGVDASNTDGAAALFDLFNEILGDEGYRRLRKMIKAGQLDSTGLRDIFQWLMEEWASFPTQPSAASTPSQPASGTRSTGRARPKASTPSK